MYNTHNSDNPSLPLKPSGYRGKGPTQPTMKTKKLSRKNGFTLIELLVTIAVLAVIVAIGIPTLNNVSDSGKEARVHSDVQQIVEGFALLSAESTRSIPLAPGATGTEVVTLWEQGITTKTGHRFGGIAVADKDAVAKQLGFNGHFVYRK